MDQIQFLLGHVAVPTTERYLGCKRRIRGAVNDHIGFDRSRGARYIGAGRRLSGKVVEKRFERRVIKYDD